VTKAKVVAFTCDLEPDCPPFLQGFRGVEHGMPALLDMLVREGIVATFFTTGEVASRYPAIVQRLVDEGHELACHGMTHRAFTELDPQTARYEIEESSRILREFSNVTSFRAPYLKFPGAYVAMLEHNGFTLDSSHARYKAAYYRDDTRTSLTRVPASVTSSVLRLARPIRGAYLAALSSPVVLFVHPWEFVDLTREKLRLDCRFKTGDVALACVSEVLRGYRDTGASFVRMRELVA
jgi:peptidoglycan/xylan/chitin deacetylase (PgdA/CDA1 family)